MRVVVLIAFVLISMLAHANGDPLSSVRVQVFDESTNQPLENAHVGLFGQLPELTNDKGECRLPFKGDSLRIQITYVGYISIDTLLLRSNIPRRIVFKMRPTIDLDEAVIISKTEDSFSTPGQSIENFTVYAAKKADIIRPKELQINHANRNPRQLFAKVAGVTIWDNSDGGEQLSIGSRGLNPNRTANFNTRQNGYDISADPLGYPETYYTPPTQAIERIDFIRGAAGLQFGPQFGGMINFDLVDPSERPFDMIAELTVGSFDSHNAYMQASGTKGKADYLVYSNLRRGEGWRDRSAFQSSNSHVQVGWGYKEDSKVSIEYTHYRYEGEMPGGLTDVLFERAPETVLRERNFFKVDWDMLAVVWEHRFSPVSRVQVRPFLLRANRSALGVLGRINRADLGGDRELISGDFSNEGIEARWERHHEIGSLPSTLLLGGRWFHGNTRNRQGLASDGDDADFSFISDVTAQTSDYYFRNRNLSLFLEEVLRFKNGWILTPGIRYERIETGVEGAYTRVLTDIAGNVLPTWPRTYAEDKLRARDILLYGLGISKKWNGDLEAYANYSRNYRAINFSDIRIINPNQVVDSSITDETGFTADIGIRGKLAPWLHVDASVFHLSYQDKISNVLDTMTLNPVLGPQLVQVRTNLSQATSEGLELAMEWRIARMLKLKEDWEISVFGNVALMRSAYRSEDSSVDGNVVEYAPTVNMKSGARFGWKDIAINYQFTYVSEQFSDATNAPAGFDPYAVAGAILAFYVHDVSLRYSHGSWTLACGVDNLLDASYFTRRASGYPGPGIIPANPRNGYVTLRWNLHHD